MPEKLPEHTDHIEDFYKSAFSKETEMPSPELWGKVAAKLESIPPVIHTYEWKNGLIRLSIEALLLLSLAYYVTRPASGSSILLPEQKQTPFSVTPATIKRDVPANSTQPEPSLKSADKKIVIPKETGVNASEVITDEIVEKTPEPEAEEIIAVPEVPVMEVIKKETPAINEKQDLYSKLKKNYVTDSTKSLFIEKKK